MTAPDHIIYHQLSRPIRKRLKMPSPAVLVLHDAQDLGTECEGKIGSSGTRISHLVRGIDRRALGIIARKRPRLSRKGISVLVCEAVVQQVVVSVNRVAHNEFGDRSRKKVRVDGGTKAQSCQIVSE